MRDIKIGQIVKIISDNENYTAFADKELIITSKANKYMPAHEFYNRNKPAGFHPGYDKGLTPEYLCDFKVKETGEDVPFSLYEYEFEIIN